MIVYVSLPMSVNMFTCDEISDKIFGAGNSAIFCNNNGVERYEAIAVSDAFVLAPSWDKDDGCIAEKEYAESLKIPVYEYPNVPEMHPTEARCPNQAKMFRELLGKMYRVHLSKNADYSPANIAGTGELGLTTRMWDKMARLMNLSGFNLEAKLLSFSQPKQPKNESIEDTLMDLAVYSLINLLYRAGKWGN